MRIKNTVFYTFLTAAFIFFVFPVSVANAGKCDGKNEADCGKERILCQWNVPNKVCVQMHKCSDATNTNECNSKEAFGLVCEWKKSACVEVTADKEEKEEADKLEEGLRELRSKAGDLNVAKSTSIPSLIGNVISAALGIIGSVALAIIIYGGILWMTAAGNSERARKAALLLMWAALGIVIILISYFVVQFVFEPFATSPGSIR